jgi:hypothetical protein
LLQDSGVKFKKNAVTIAMDLAKAAFTAKLRSDLEQEHRNLPDKNLRTSKQ